MTSIVAIPAVETDRLRLRSLREADHGTLAAFYASDRARFVGGPMDAEQTWRMLAVEIGHWTLRGYGRWAVEEKATGAFCGVIGPWNPLGWPEPEVGWDLMNGFEGRGYGGEAGRAALAHVFGPLGWTTAISMVAEGNDRSAALALRLGARAEGAYTHPRFGAMTIYRHSAPEVPQ